MLFISKGTGQKSQQAISELLSVSKRVQSKLFILLGGFRLNNLRITKAIFSVLKRVIRLALSKVRLRLALSKLIKIEITMTYLK